MTIVYVAWRDLRFARGRFALIEAVVALITLLVGFLAGLTGGLAAQNVSAVLALPGDRLVLQQPGTGQPSFSESSLDAQTVATWQTADSVSSVVPISIIQGRATGPAGAVAVALVGIPADAGATSSMTELAPSANDQVGLSSDAADDLGVTTGETLSIANATFTVASVGDDLWYSHTPVVVMTPTAWARADTALGGDGEVTALAVSGTPDWSQLAAATSTKAFSHLGSLSALETFRSEVGSLALMIAMLFGVSALVVGAFFTVWTMQRAADVAVLKALGASTGSLVADALGQALFVLTIGIGTGMAVVLGLSTLVSGSLPFLVSVWTTVVPAVLMAVLGLLGAAAALHTITRADPLTALGSNR